MATILWPILRQAIRHPKRVAVIDDQRQWRYLDLVGGAFHLARALKAQTDKPRIGVMLPTGGLFPMTAIATWMLGRTLVPINYLLSPAERQYVIDDSEIDTLVTVGPMLDYLEGEIRNVNLLKLDEMNFKGLPPLRLPAVASSDDIAVILYTSGTSGKPKGVMLTHGNLRSNVEGCVEHMGLTSTDGFVGVLPQFHSFGMTALTLLPLTIGATTINTARFHPRKIISLIKKHRPDIMMAIPSMYGALLTVKKASPEDLASIRLAVSGGEPLPQDVFDRFKERFGIELREGYGLTETSPVATMNQFDNYRHKSVGRPLPGCTIQIRDEQGGVLPFGEEGQIHLAGPNIMAGYFKLEEKTAEVIGADRYFDTGDWGRVDEEGFLYITGRVKEMLIIGGENVFPREIEEVLNHHPSVKASAVIGKQDAVRGELPVAFIELEEGVDFDEAALRTHCREHLAGYKVPREIHVVDALPRNPTGKILRRELKAD